MSELLPCPFCGSDDSDESVEVLEDKFGCYIVQCGCRASSSSELGASNAISAWNKRASGWQPIETAPLDGTVVDLWLNNSRWIDCWWDAGKGKWREKTGVFYDGHTPTHWLPVPAGPKELDQCGQNP